MSVKALRCSIIATALGLCLLSPPLLFGYVENLVNEIEGKGSANTRPFTVSQNWEVQYEVKSGGLFAIALHDSQGNLISFLAKQIVEGSGRSFYPKGGTYYLNVTSSSDWTIKIVELRKSKLNTTAQ